MKTKIILWPRATAKGKFILKLRISDSMKTVYRGTGIEIDRKQWDDKKDDLRNVRPGDTLEYRDFLTLRNTLSEIAKPYNEKILSLAKEGRTVTVDQLVNLVENPVRKSTVFSYIADELNRFKIAQNLGMVKLYKMTLASLKGFDNTDMYFHDIDVHYLKRYVDHLRGKNLKDTSISVYVRTLRMIYNNAIGEGFAKEIDYPFGRKNDKTVYTVSTLKDATPKRAITEAQMNSIIELKDLTEQQEQAREIFLFSYFAAGINFNDILKLKWEQNIKNESGDLYLCYARTKTSKEMKTLLVGYAKNLILKLKLKTGIDPDNYVFDILNIHIHKTPQQIENRIHKVLGQTNKHLKEIAVKAEIRENLSTYTARHSMITHFANSGSVSPYELQNIVGHSDLKTTMIYYKKPDQQKQNEIMRKFANG